MERSVLSSANRLVATVYVCVYSSGLFSFHLPARFCWGGVGRFPEQIKQNCSGSERRKQRKNLGWERKKGEETCLCCHQNHGSVIYERVSKSVLMSICITLWLWCDNIENFSATFLVLVFVPSLILCLSAKLTVQYRCALWNCIVMMVAVDSLMSMRKTSVLSSFFTFIVVSRWTMLNDFHRLHFRSRKVSLV